tara:strand:- start:15228 stop:16292 length:1065 start_codon:yes stop_codon:yes gene_type:complete
MAFTSQRYGANHYSGANVTVSMGACILSQVHGVEWNVMQAKRPIYGYNSQYYDAISNGVVQVNGTLYVNFVSPRYLPACMMTFFEMSGLFNMMLNAASDDDEVFQRLGDYISGHPGVIDLMSAMSQFLDIPHGMIPTQSDPGDTWVDFGSELQTLEQEQQSYDASVRGGQPEINTSIASDPLRQLQPNDNQLTFDELLNNAFENDSITDALTRIIWGGQGDLTGTGVIGEDSYINNDLLNLRQISNLVAARLGREGSVNIQQYRPDQIGVGSDGAYGLDIVITYGAPFGEQITDTTFQYDHSCSRIIKGVQFIGESTQIMADGAPILEVYPFIARSVNAYPTLHNRNVDTSGIG